MTDKKNKVIKSDALFKSILEEEIAAREFLEYYLPADFKALVDLSQIKVEKESYVEDNLKRRLSDIVYSIKTKDNQEAFVYVLLEHQSKPDYWMALRLWKYMLLLCERHQDAEKKKLPLIAPIVFYNGSKKYDSSLNLWNLFADPEQARQLMSGDYKLIDLKSMSDDKIKQKRYLGMLEYFMKHIHTRDMLKLWDRFLGEFNDAVLLDQKNGYVYIKKLLWYTDTKVSEEQQPELAKILATHLSKDQERGVMRSIAQKYIDEGIEQGVEIGMRQAAINMIKQKVDPKFISAVTGLSMLQIAELKAKCD
jgi:predicted transposase/invertase (TIGR01784 family)